MIHSVSHSKARVRAASQPAAPGGRLTPTTALQLRQGHLATWRNHPVSDGTSATPTWTRPRPDRLGSREQSERLAKGHEGSRCFGRSRASYLPPGVSFAALRTGRISARRGFHRRLARGRFQSASSFPYG